MPEARATVLMPVYNTEQYVGEAIRSILNQTFKNFIFLIIDDGSTDRTLEIITSFEDSRIKLVQNSKNLGFVSALNKGISLIDTKYIIRMDADDISLPERFEEQIAFMDNNPKIGVSSSHIKAFGESEGVWDVPLQNDEIKAALLFRSPFSHPATIIRTQILENNKLLYRTTYPPMEDYDLWYRLKDITHFENLDKVLLLYRRMGQNMSSQNKHAFFETLKEFYRNIIPDLSIRPTEEELMLHVEICRPAIPLSNSIANYRKWMNKLVEKNRQTGVFPQESLIRILNNKWEQLFNRVIPLGFIQVMIYFQLSRKMNWNNLIYYSRYLIKKLIHVGQ